MNVRDLLSTTKDVLILGHHNADPDAVCAMIAFSHLYKFLNPEGIATLACDDISRLANQVLSKLAPDMEIIEETNRDYEFVVILDTNSSLQLGPAMIQYVLDPSKVLIIDHHEENPRIHEIADYAIVKSDRSSVCEVLTDLYIQLDVPITKLIADLLLTGMLFDTRRFFYADQKTLETAVSLIKCGADYNACVGALVIKADRSERIARLKAARRLDIHNVGEWLIVTAKIGAYEASACRGLIELGADVAIVGGKPSKNVVRISTRSTQEFYNITGVNLSTDVMEPIGELIDGKGGGHPNAAGANGKRGRTKALAHSVELIRDAVQRNQAGLGSE